MPIIACSVYCDAINDRKAPNLKMQQADSRFNANLRNVQNSQQNISRKATTKIRGYQRLSLAFAVASGVRSRSHYARLVPSRKCAFGLKGRNCQQKHENAQNLRFSFFFVFL